MKGEVVTCIECGDTNSMESSWKFRMTRNWRSL